MDEQDLMEELKAMAEAALGFAGCTISYSNTPHAFVIDDPHAGRFKVLVLEEDGE